MMTTKNKALAGLATAAAVLAPGLAAPAASVSAVPRLTKASAAAAAQRDGQAGAVITGGDKVVVTGCRPVKGGAYTCSVELIPAHSSSRCRWIATVRLIKGRPTVVGYSHARCTN